jgi:hypothetical protein
MATVPLSGSNIRFLSGVPFYSDYKHTRWFDTITDQTNWFSLRSVVHSMINVAPTYFNKNDRGHFIRVDKNKDQLWGTNYVIFQNTDYNNKWFYGFVDHLEYVNKAVTNVYFHIDVLQTWMFEMNFKPSYIVREHCKLWEADGTPVINTQDEGLNYGTEYDTSSVTQFTPYDGYKWLVILSKVWIHDVTAQDNLPHPTVIGTPQPLSVYITPFKDNDTVPQVIQADGNGMIVSKPTKVLLNLYTDTDAVNNIVSLYVTDFTGIPVTYTDNTFTLSEGMEPVQVQGGSDGACNLIHVKDVLSFDTLEYNNGDKWTGYTPVKESKLMLSPYTQLILDDFRGNRVTYKTEYINDSELKLLVKGSVGTSNKTSYGIKEYNFSANGLQDSVSDEFALINNEPNDIPIITNMLSAYIQGNRNSLQTQKDHIFFNGYASILGGLIPLAGAVGEGNTLAQGSSSLGILSGAANTVMSIQKINAKIKDITNTPPSIAKMGSNTSYTLGNGYDGVYIIKKQIKPEYIQKLESFFNMYGYKVNEVKLPNFHTRQYWNYVQTTSCVIQGNFNNEDLHELKMIFDSGITLWHTDDIGNYSLENEVIA